MNKRIPEFAQAATHPDRFAEVAYFELLAFAALIGAKMSLEVAPMFAPVESFDSGVLFWDVDGIPVSEGAGVGPSLIVAWDVPGGRPFAPESLSSNGVRVPRSFFIDRAKNFSQTSS